jgi:flap endonuclease-1
MNINLSPAKMLPSEPFICYYNRNKHKYALIDASVFLNKFGIGTYNGKTIIVNNDMKNISDIYLSLVATVRFLSENVIPVFVFDGKSPQVKSEVVTKRREVKKQADEALREKYSDNTDTEKKTEVPYRTLDELIRHLKRSYRIDKQTIETFKAILRYMGLPLVEAPAEADPQCVAIASYYDDKVVGIVTDDFDFLMYGAKNILKYQNILKILKKIKILKLLELF